MIQSYPDLRVWQAGMDLAEDCYGLTQGFPREEIYGLTSQIRRAATSVPANIAEGYGRGGPKEFAQFLRISQGSLKELETHLLLARRMDFCAASAADGILEQTDQIGRMLYSLLRSAQDRATNGHPATVPK